MRVLVVDDDTFVRMMLAMELEDVEFEEASRLEAAYNLARDQHFDAIIVDRRLPDGDGIDLVRRLRSAPRTHRTPILVLTAGYDPADAEEVLEAGADVYLPKPFEPEDLVGRLMSVLDLPPRDRRPRREDAASRIAGGEDVDQLGDPILDPSADFDGTSGQDTKPKRRGIRRLFGGGD